jgi:hypothetical protein
LGKKLIGRIAEIYKRFFLDSANNSNLHKKFMNERPTPTVKGLLSELRAASRSDRHYALQARRLRRKSRECAPGAATSLR